jgi:hypothetical protein
MSICRVGNVVHTLQEVTIFYLGQSIETTEGTESSLSRVAGTGRLDPTCVESPSTPPEMR